MCLFCSLSKASPSWKRLFPYLVITSGHSRANFVQHVPVQLVLFLVSSELELWFWIIWLFLLWMFSGLQVLLDLLQLHTILLLLFKQFFCPTWGSCVVCTGSRVESALPCLQLRDRSHSAWIAWCCSRCLRACELVPERVVSFGIGLQ